MKTNVRKTTNSNKSKQFKKNNELNNLLTALCVRRIKILLSTSGATIMIKMTSKKFQVLLASSIIKITTTTTFFPESPSSVCL